MQQETKTINATKGNLFISGLIYFLLVAVALWLFYGIRLTQIKLTDSQIQSIQEEILSQITTDELDQLETRSSKMAVLYEKPFATKLLQEIAGAVPRNTTLSSLSLGEGQVTLEGSSPSYAETALFVVALTKQSTILNNPEITQVSKSESAETNRVVFSIEANIK